MNNTPLERLLTDAALGELASDSRWLLERYLSEHPEHRREVEEIGATVALARQTLKAREPEELPLPPMPNLRQPHWTTRLRWLLPPAVGAACLMIGWSLGALQGQTSPREVPRATRTDPRLAPSSPRPRIAMAGSQRQPGGFWSSERWTARILRARGTHKGTPRIIEWQSPFVPKVEEGRTPEPGPND